ncbi:hypothetical protein DdX_12139 [Ditylenchus destructor]|uniref:Uncharacterized protein n=1 Tax=Ditylenchus destructor TaxID=166010 RepID=A0AAD4MVL8_9BILA|nr:hypothetical protein DdX_12139 [Ditylenchus destructor]
MKFLPPTPAKASGTHSGGSQEKNSEQHSNSTRLSFVDKALKSYPEKILTASRDRCHTLGTSRVSDAAKREIYAYKRDLPSAKPDPSTQTMTTLTDESIIAIVTGSAESEEDEQDIEIMMEPIQIKGRNRLRKSFLVISGTKRSRFW